MAYRVPSFSYPGGKVQLRKWMVKRMPASGRKYVEPFAGRGNVFWLAVHMLDFREWHLNDPWTARWFEAIRSVNIEDIPDHLTEAISKEYRDRAVSNRKSDDVAVALEDRTMFGGGAKGGIGNQWRYRSKLDGFRGRLKTARAILNSVELKITALEWEDCHLGNLEENDFVYLDPPYEEAGKNLYHHDTVDHRELLTYLLSAPHLWMISGYRSPLYTRMVEEPESEVSYQMVMHNRRSGELPVMRRECIWTNYTIGPDGVPKRKRLKRRRIRKRRVNKKRRRG